MTVPLFETGEFPVGMHLFKTNEYSLTDMYNSPPTLELLNNRNYMFVGIRHIEPIGGVTLQIIKMWATPDSTADNAIKYQLVTDQCTGTVGKDEGWSYKSYLKIINTFYIIYYINLDSNCQRDDNIKRSRKLFCN